MLVSAVPISSRQQTFSRLKTHISTKPNRQSDAVKPANPNTVPMFRLNRSFTSFGVNSPVSKYYIVMNGYFLY